MMTLLWACAQSPSEPSVSPEDAAAARSAEAPAAEAPAAEAPGAEANGPTAESRAYARADQLLDEARTRLQERLMREMSTNGPAKAVEVCSTEAQALVGAGATNPGEQVGRASLRLRNPANTGPDWVRAWLEAQGAVPAEGLRRVDETAQGRVARVLRPIVVEPRCLACHGPEETLQPEVRAALDQRYPDDQATGYAAGDLRGAFWAEVRLDGG